MLVTVLAPRRIDQDPVPIESLSDGVVRGARVEWDERAVTVRASINPEGHPLGGIEVEIEGKDNGYYRIGPSGRREGAIQVDAEAIAKT